MRHRSDDRSTRTFYSALLHRRNVVSDIRRRNDLFVALGDYFYGRRFLVYEVCADRDVCVHWDSGGGVLLRVAKRRAGVGITDCRFPIAD